MRRVLTAFAALCAFACSPPKSEVYSGAAWFDEAGDARLLDNGKGGFTLSRVSAPWDTREFLQRYENSAPSLVVAAKGEVTWVVAADKQRYSAERPVWSADFRLIELKDGLATESALSEDQAHWVNGVVAGDDAALVAYSQFGATEADDTFGLARWNGDGWEVLGDIVTPYVTAPAFIAAGVGTAVYCGGVIYVLDEATRTLRVVSLPDEPQGDLDSYSATAAVDDTGSPVFFEFSQYFPEGADRPTELRMRRLVIGGAGEVSVATVSVWPVAQDDRPYYVGYGLARDAESVLVVRPDQVLSLFAPAGDAWSEQPLVPMNVVGSELLGVTGSPPRVLARLNHDLHLLLPDDESGDSYSVISLGKIGRTYEPDTGCSAGSPGGGFALLVATGFLRRLRHRAALSRA